MNLPSGDNPSVSSAPADRVTHIRRALETVNDPEIPVINVVDMGMIADVRCDGDVAVVDMTPTFAGCPALDVIREDIRQAVTKAGEAKVTVNVVFEPPWTTERISEAGKAKLKAFGLAPPVKACGGATSAPSLEQIPCPRCSSTNTQLESIFGPTLCRSIHYCDDCRESFEHFKAV